MHGHNKPSFPLTNSIVQAVREDEGHKNPFSRRSLNHSLSATHCGCETSYRSPSGGWKSVWDCLQGLWYVILVADIILLCLGRVVKSHGIKVEWLFRFAVRHTLFGQKVLLLNCCAVGLELWLFCSHEEHPAGKHWGNNWSQILLCCVKSVGKGHVVVSQECLRHWGVVLIWSQWGEYLSCGCRLHYIYAVCHLLPLR
jgi:hypothetical protein